jgi:hypothetical protein
MHVAASTLSCARKPKTFGNDEQDSGCEDEAISVDEVPAAMGAAPVGADRADLVRVPARLSRTSASRWSSARKSESFDEGGNGVGVVNDVGVALAVMRAAPIGVVGAKAAHCV